VTRDEWIQEVCEYAGLIPIPVKVREALEWMPEPVPTPYVMAKIVLERLSAASTTMCKPATS
jgi:hypothetical protein